MNLEIFRESETMSILVVTHADDDRKPDPRLTNEGFRKVLCTIEILMGLNEFGRSIDIQLVIDGFGNRFEQMYKSGLLEPFCKFYGLPRIKCELVGTSIFTNDITKRVITPEGLESNLQDCISTHECFPPIIFWEFFLKRKIDRIVKGDKLFLSGRSILRSLGASKKEHFSNRAFMLNLESRTIECIIENNQLLDTPRHIAVNIGNLTEEELRLWSTIYSGFGKRSSML